MEIDVTGLTITRKNNIKNKELIILDELEEYYFCCIYNDVYFFDESPVNTTVVDILNDEETNDKMKMQKLESYFHKSCIFTIYSLSPVVAPMYIQHIFSDYNYEMINVTVFGKNIFHRLVKK